MAVEIDLFRSPNRGLVDAAHIDRRLVVGALQMAIAARKPPTGLIHQSDRGVQYACDEYQELLANAAIKCSMNRNGNSRDKAVVESFSSTLKEELVYRSVFVDHNTARAAISDYLGAFYNRLRLYSTRGYISRMGYERRASRQN